MNSVSELELQTEEAADFAREAMRGMPVPARAGVVNRTHRVVRERAKLLQERRTRDRSLLLPMILCSVLLILSAFAVWSGLYQYQVVEAAEADVVTLATTDASNHLMVVMAWFVPVFLALVATIWVRRSRTAVNDGAI